MRYFCLLLIVNTGLALNGVCPPGAVKSTTSNVCYIFSSTTATFIQAQFQCTEQNGTLVNIDSEFTNTLVASNAGNKSRENFWIGATLTKVYNDAGVTKIWAWEGLDKFVKYDSWGFNEPSNKGGCAAVKTSDGTWFAEDCSSLKNYICSVPMTIDVCEDQWTYFSDTNYCYIILYQSDFNSAESACMTHKAHLVSIHNKEENDFVQEIAHSGVSYSDWSDATYIGLYTTTNDNSVWNWTDGSPNDYMPWMVNNPGAPGRQKCVLMSTDPEYENPAGYWVNIECDLKMRNYVCKKLPNQVKIL